MDRDTEQLNLLAIFHYVITGVAALFTFSPLLYSGRRHLHICRATRHTKTRRRVAARISRLDFYRDRLAIVFAGDCDRDLHFDRRSLIGEASSLLVCIRDCMRRMPLHSLWNNPRRVHDHRALARIRESVVCGNADVSLKIASGRRRPNLSYRRRINSHCGNLEKAQCNSRQSVLAQRAHCPPVENPVREALLSCSCRSASALLLFTFKAPASAAPSSTSTQRPPV